MIVVINQLGAVSTSLFNPPTLLPGVALPILLRQIHNFDHLLSLRVLDRAHSRLDVLDVEAAALAVREQRTLKSHRELPVVPKFEQFIIRLGLQVRAYLVPRELLQVPVHRLVADLERLLLGPLGAAQVGVLPLDLAHHLRDGLVDLH